MEILVIREINILQVGVLVFAHHLDVLIEGRDDEQHMAYGRSYREAPDVDGQVFIEGDDISQPGDIVKVRILQGFDYDVVGERVDA